MTTSSSGEKNLVILDCRDIRCVRTLHLYIRGYRCTVFCISDDSTCCARCLTHSRALLLALSLSLSPLSPPLARARSLSTSSAAHARTHPPPHHAERQIQTVRCSNRKWCRLLATVRTAASACGRTLQISLM